MCKAPKPPPMQSLPAQRANRYNPQRSGVALNVQQRIGATAGGYSQVPGFAMPVVTARLGGTPQVLGG